jgi:hypothetical protein
MQGNIFFILTLNYELIMLYSEMNMQARLYNSTINNPHTSFHPLRKPDNTIIPGFPVNGEAYSSLSRTKNITLYVFKLRFTNIL